MEACVSRHFKQWLDLSYLILIIQNTLKRAVAPYSMHLHSCLGV